MKTAYHFYEEMIGLSHENHFMAGKPVQNLGNLNEKIELVRQIYYKLYLVHYVSFWFILVHYGSIIHNPRQIINSQ